MQQQQPSSSLFLLSFFTVSSIFDTLYWSDSHFGILTEKIRRKKHLTPEFLVHFSSSSPSGADIGRRMSIETLTIEL